MQFLSKLSLAVASIVIALGLIEGGLRAFPVIVQKNYANLAWNHWIYHNNHTLNKEALDYYTSAYAFDPAVGYLSKRIINEIEAKKACFTKKKYSILILGDSVSEDGKYPDFLRTKLQQTYGTENIEVLNAGVSGYDTKIEEAFLRNFGIHYNPDLVILQFNINDFTGTPVFIRNGTNSWLAFNTNARLDEVNKTLFQYSRMYQYYVFWLLKDSQTETDPTQVVKEPLAKIADFLKAQKKDLVIVYFPKFEASEDTVEKHALFTNIVSELQLSPVTLDLTETYQDMELAEISLDTTHPNEKGNYLAGEKIFEFLKPRLNKTLTPITQ